MQVLPFAARAGYGGGYAVKSGGQAGEEVAPRRGQLQGVARALEQPHPHLGLQRLDLTADGAVGHVQLGPGQGGAAGPRHGLERPQRVQRGQGGAGCEILEHGLTDRSLSH
ncbi:hypothetical protein D3C75_1044820 [compost metagenome]